MKTRIYWILTAALLMMGACTNDLPITQQNETGAVLDEIPVDLGVVVMPQVDDEGTTRASYVTGEDTPNITASTRVKLLCFDLTGLFVASREGVIAPTDNKSGKLTATVPTNTARIHFLFNYPSGMSVSPATEAVLMQHQSMTVGTTDDMSYWGYHRESTTSAMASWLSAGTNTVKLLRDRAQLNVENYDNNISSIVWAVTNAYKRGLMAPKAAGNSSQVSYPNSYENDTDIAVTPFTGAGTYNLSAPAGSDVASFLAAGWTSEADSQYLMEDHNMRDPVKVLLRVTFRNNSVKFFVMKLQDDYLRPLSIRRNHRYTLKVTHLEETRGYDTVAQALASDAFANDPYANIDDLVTDLNDGNNTLSIKSSYEMIMDDEATDHMVNFRYFVNSTGLGVSNGHLVAMWVDKDAGDNTPEAAYNNSEHPTVNYNKVTGEGTIVFEIAPVEANTKKLSILRLISTDSGLYRDIDIYSIGHTPNVSLVSAGSNQYRLTFDLPPGLLHAIFPITIRLTSWTLQPRTLEYDITKDISVKATSTNVPPISTDNTATPRTWNFKATEWNKWYECTIDYKDPQPSSYSILLDDVRSSIAENNRSTNVGLYFEIVGFYSLTAITP